MNREELLARAAQDFIDKVDRGAARSEQSYAAFKAALSAPAQCAPSPDPTRLPPTGCLCRNAFERSHCAYEKRGECTRVSSTERCDGADDLEHLDGMLDDRERG